ncbi:AsmA-like C-terminal domain-containing protein [Thermodesulfobacteriota bacterium]
MSLWILGATGTLLLLLLALILILPKLIDLESVRGKIQEETSKIVGGEVEFQEIDLSILPLPHVVIQKANLSVPGKLSGTLESLKVYPKILPLLSAKVQISKVLVESPDFRLHLPLGSKKDQKQDERTVPELLEPLLLHVPDMIFEMNHGRLNVIEGDQSLFLFENIQTRILFPPTGFELQLQCASNLWGKMAIEATLHAGDYKGKGRIDLTRFYAHRLTGYLFPDAPLQLDDYTTSLSVDFTMAGLRNLQASIEGSLPSITLSRAKKKLVAKGQSFKGSLHLDEGKITASLSEFILDYPQLRLSGNFVMDEKLPRSSVELEGIEIDIPSVRSAALALAGDIPTIQDIFDYVKGGKVTRVTLKSKGEHPTDLGNLDNLLIKAGIIEGQISIPEVDLDLEEVKGEAVISGGTLKVKNIEARMGDSWGHQGKLKLDLIGDEKKFHLDIPLDADLKELPSILKGFIEDQTFINEIDLVEDLKGNAKGRLVLGESTSSIKARLEISELQLSAKYKRIPYPLEITGGRFSYDKSGVRVMNLSGRLGESSFSRLSAGLHFEKGPQLEVESGRAALSLNEFYLWLSSLEGLSDDLEDVKDLKGSINLSSIRLKGPLSKLENLQFQTVGEFDGIALNTNLLPGPIKLDGGRFEAVGDSNHQKATFNDIHINMLDTSLKAGGTLNNFLKGLGKTEITLDGDIGSKTTNWVAQKIKLSPEIVVPSHLTISDTRLTWNQDAAISVAGELAMEDGPRVSFDILRNPKMLIIRDLLVRDETSHASLSLKLKEREFGGKFSGHITDKTISKFYHGNQSLKGSIEGDFEAHVLMDHPMRSTARGKLSGQDLILPIQMKMPLKIESFSLDAEKKHVKVESARFTLADMKGDLDGDVNFSETGVLFDMNLSTDGVDWADIEKMLGGDKKEKDTKKAGKSPGLPLQGTLKLKAGYFKYDPYTWRPLHADISFSPDGLKVAVTEGNLCGVSTPGTLKVSPQHILLDFAPFSKDQDLSKTIPCLLYKEERIEGRFDIAGKIKAKGKKDDLVRSLQGNVEFDAKDMRIYNNELLARVFDVLNVTQIFAGHLPDLRKEGFGFNSVKVKADIKGGKFVYHEILLDGATLKITGEGEMDLVSEKLDFSLLVAPFKTVDTILGHVPLFGNMLSDAVSVAVKVKGDIKNPKVLPLAPGAVGSKLKNMMIDTLKAPVKIMEHPFQGKEEE